MTQLMAAILLAALVVVVVVQRVQRQRDGNHRTDRKHADEERDKCFAVGHPNSQTPKTALV